MYVFFILFKKYNQQLQLFHKLNFKHHILQPQPNKYFHSPIPLFPVLQFLKPARTSSSLILPLAPVPNNVSYLTCSDCYGVLILSFHFKHRFVFGSVTLTYMYSVTSILDLESIDNDFNHFLAYTRNPLDLLLLRCFFPDRSKL